MRLKRAAGVLLHLTSLPSPYGIGDLGEGAYNFIDFLSAGKQTLWQILPLHPVGYGESPYQCFSAFAGNPLLIAPDLLAEQGLLTAADLKGTPTFPFNTIDFPAVRAWKIKILRLAYQRFKQNSPLLGYQEFLRKNTFWLSDFTLFMALKEYFEGKPWTDWEEGLASRKEWLLEQYQEKLREQIDFQIFLQYIFWEQWHRLRSYANSRGVQIIGDLPIFVAADSSDTWANPRLFRLDSQGRPLAVAGVPPDYFSPTGQRWGNPLYCWDIMQEDDFSWWRERIRHLLVAVDYLRIDHFRGFEAYWEIPAAEETAINGRWVKGPGTHFFAVLEKQLGKLPIIAEDLGFITPEVQTLKESFAFPGMKVLQFLTAEKLAGRPELENVVYYTGTHDNDTLLGWYQEKVLSLLDRPQDNPKICREFIEILYQSNAAWAIVPLQDILGLSSEARMNTPGTLGGNWRWRLEPEALTEDLAQRMCILTRQNKR